MKFIATLVAASLAFAQAQGSPADVGILNTPNGGYRSETHGGGGGDPFDHYSADTSAVPDLIVVRAGSEIDQICAHYTQSLSSSPYKCAGGGGGNQHEFHIDVKGGEYVNSISIASDSYPPPFLTPIIDGIQFHTNRNRSSAWYGGGHHLPNRTITWGTDMQVYAFFGRAGSLVDNIGFVIGPNCLDIEDRVGEWKPVGSTNGVQSYSYYHGTTNSWATETSETFGETSTTEFSRSFATRRTNSSKTVTGETSHFVASSASSEFSTTESYERTFQFHDAGVVWQWDFESEGICGHSTTKTDNLMLTANGAEEPCCLPGAFRDFNNPHSGGCVGLRGEPAVNLC